MEAPWTHEGAQICAVWGSLDGGTDALVHIETLQFDDGLVAIGDVS